MDYVAAAAALLSEVGLTFDDVYELGRPWLIGPAGFTTVIGRPKYEGIYRPPSRQNPTSRQRALIGLTGPVDSDVMLSILSHECGHVFFDEAFTSRPEYEQEHRAIRYGLAAFERVTGRPPHDWIVQRERKYLRWHCWRRQQALGDAIEYRGWKREIVEWCGFRPAIESYF
jgi:hypothetical protein